MRADRNDRAPERRARLVVATESARRAARSAAVWGVVLGALVFQQAVSYRSDFPTREARENFARTFGHNTALAAVIGPARRIDTVGGYLAWRMFGLLMIVGAIWGLLMGTRLLRGEEDAGRWELLLAGRTDRRGATIQALGGLAVGCFTFWAAVAAFTIVAGARPHVGFSPRASLFYALAATASVAVFAALGALSSQLGSTRRQANGIAAAAFGAAYLLRFVADSGTGLAWLRWASPLGWVENLAPLTGPRPLAFLPVAATVGVAAAATVICAARRDAGSGLVVRSGRSRSRLRLLDGPGLLALRLERWVALAWIAGLAALAALFGVVAESAAEANVGVKAVEQAVGRLGGRAGGASAWIGYEFLYLAALVGFAAAGQVAAIRSEEAEGHLDHLLARPLGRTRWLAGRLGFTATFMIAVAAAAGIGGWAGLAARSSHIALSSMLEAGLNSAAPALFVLGAGTLLYGLLPRLAAPLLYALVLWSFVVEIVGSSVTANHWLLDTAIFTHIGPVPASQLNWTAIAWLAGSGIAAAGAGIWAFRRRDLVPA